jgi:opacity protein-like surface antigen
MSQRNFFTVACLLVGFLPPLPLAAQSMSKLTVNLGAGFTEPVRYSDRRLETGFNITAGAGVNFAPRAGLLGEFGYNQLGVSSAVLRAAGAPNGSARIYSLTANPIFRFNPSGRFDVYAIGGGGYYRRTLEFTQPAVAAVTAFDPFYGIFFPVAVPASVVLGSFTQNEGGLNIGGGITVRTRGDSNVKFYAESRYHYLFTNPVRTTLLPVTFGIRW